MLTRSIRTGDFVVIRNRRDDEFLALVEARGANGVTALPLNDKRSSMTVPSRQIVGHYKRRQSDLRGVRVLVARIRIAIGVDRDTAHDERDRRWSEADSLDVQFDEDRVPA